ncbi:MAG TPA: alpha/beta fold hydrolase [Chloroflexota bacterium]|nr:alpha/beta fold hydrolase [Chloroflexota bacterium]
MRTESGYAPVNGTRLYYEITGQGHPLLFIHAGIADCRMWDPQWEALSDRFTLVRFDVRGFGRSEQPGVPCSLTDDLSSLLAYIGIDRPFVVGCSMGGSVAIDFALEYHEDVAALVTVGAGVSGNKTTDPGMIAQWAAIDAATSRGEYPEAVELELRMWVDGIGRTPGDVAPAVRERVREMDLALIQRGEPELDTKEIEPPALGRLGEITVPTLVMVGRHDQPGVLETADLVANGIKGARKVELPDTAHLPNMEVPDRFNALLIEFLTGIQSTVS